jgi:hypothetical protein
MVERWWGNEFAGYGVDEVCAADKQDWPCDAAREHALADQLAEALYKVTDIRSETLRGRITHPHCCQYVDDHGSDCHVGRALAAYEEARK